MTNPSGKGRNGDLSISIILLKRRKTPSFHLFQEYISKYLLNAASKHCSPSVGMIPFSLAKYNPTGFRDRLLCLMLKEGGFRIGELLGMHMDDLEFGKHGMHVRFRTDNENG